MSSKNIQKKKKTQWQNIHPCYFNKLKTKLREAYHEDTNLCSLSSYLFFKFILSYLSWRYQPVLAFVVSKLEKCRPVQTKTVFYQRSIGQPATSTIYQCKFKMDICDMCDIDISFNQTVLNVRNMNTCFENNSYEMSFLCVWAQLTAISANHKICQSLPVAIEPIIFSNNLKLWCHYFDWHTHTRGVSQWLFRNIISRQGHPSIGIVRFLPFSDLLSDFALQAYQISAE